ncbi:MAG: hypothetical protein ACE5I5_05110 [Candidatus Heimdallarchaeota archaeon]
MSQKPINNEFYEKTKNFVISAVDLLNSYLDKGEQIPSRIVEKNKIEKNGFWRTFHEFQPLYSSLFTRHKKELQSLTEYEACINVMCSDSTITKHIDCLIGTWNIRTRITAWDYLCHFFMKLLNKRGKRFLFDLATFDRTYYDLEQFLYNDDVDLQIFSPLQNFDSDVDEINLGNDLWIRRITMNELEELLDNANVLQIPYFHVPNLKYAIELTYKTKKRFGEIEIQTIKETSPDLEVNERFNKLVTALRLFKSGIVGFNMIRTQHVLDIPITAGGSRSGLMYKPFWG